jgi:hypothetical protein
MHPAPIVTADQSLSLSYLYVAGKLTYLSWQGEGGGSDSLTSPIGGPNKNKKGKQTKKFGAARLL